MKRYAFLAPAAALAIVAFTAPAQQRPAQQATRMVVYKSPTCGCCTKWVDIMRANGFAVEVHDQDDVTPIKDASGVPESARSCHTAQVGGYVVEGHVPVADIRRLLRERPQVAGIAAGGMPVGSPGMEVGNRRDAYDVVSFTQNGRTAVFERH